MTEEKRLTIHNLRVTGPNRELAEVTFTAGLNVIAGASDTGKTFIFEALDFMMGGGDPLRRIPESIGYDTVFLQIVPSNGAPFTVRRAFDGGDVEVQEFADGRKRTSTRVLELSGKHITGSTRSLSAYLLALIDLSGREIRKDARGSKTALTFRDVSKFTLIGEERIIHQGSPVISGQFTEATRESNLFGFFLTGQDDGQIVPQEDKTKRNARLDTEANVVGEILEQSRSTLQVLAPNPREISDQTAKLDATIKELSTSIVATQEEIAALEDERKELYERRTILDSRKGFVVEQLKRLRLLDDYYRTDVERLNAVVEASKVFHELPEGICPLCHQTIATSESEDTDGHADFEAACMHEVAKILNLQGDLKSAIEDFITEEDELGRTLETVALRLGLIDLQFKRSLAPSAQSTQEELQAAIDKRTALAQAESIRSTVENLELRLQGLVQERKTKLPKLVFENRASTSAAFEFCKVVEGLLAAWKYPRLGTVSFDSDGCDLVIGGQDRANKGKGYRAVTYAAFTIGLMKYCREKGIPHPGFVVLDTPLNPFKGPMSAPDDDSLTNEVKVAFYEYLAKDKSGDQVIVLENEDPPETIRKNIRFHSFTGNMALGRFGFFPRTRLL